MNKIFLITRPNHDIVTNYLYHWSEKILTLAENKKLRVIDLRAEKANKNGYCGRVNKLAPLLICLNGHGNETSIAGQNNEIITEKSFPQYKGSIIFARSCLAAKQLGKDIVNDKLTTFIGYKEPFIFLQQKLYTASPLKDKIAGLFMRASNLAVIALIKGNPACVAHARAKEEHLKTINSLLTSEASDMETAAVRYLYWNYKNQVCLGNSNNKLV